VIWVAWPLFWWYGGVVSYQVIARKWRPQDFTELIGQTHVSQTLLNALRNQRLHHALLFTGPRGTGKTSTARILAKALRCPNAKDFLPCHTCSECLEIASGSSLNVIEIDGASNNGVDAIRELRDTIGYMPSSGKFKLYIIDEVHMLSTSAFNALLKTLEEPPAHVIFVLATTEVHKIPETVLSRCQRFDFRCIPLKLIAEHLKAICEREKVEFEMDALWMIARQGSGSMRDSQSFLDQAITFANGALTAEKVVEVLGLTDRRLLLETLEAIVGHDTARVVRLLEKLFTSGFEPRIFMNELLESARNMLMVKILDDPQSVVDLPESEIEQLRQSGIGLSEEDIHFIFDMALKGAQDIARTQDERLVLEMVLLRMANAPRIQSLLGLKSAPEARPQPQTKRSSSPNKTPAVTSSQSWLDLVQKITAVNPMVGAQLESTFLLECKDKHIVLGTSPKLKFLFDKLNQPELKKKLLNYITTFWGPGYQLEVRQGEATSESVSPKALAEQQAAQKVQATREEVESHPLVKDIQSMFKAEIRNIRNMETMETKEKR